MAGSSVTESRVQGYNFQQVILTCVGDDATGAIPDTEIAGMKEWFLFQMETNPGTPAPTANYDIALNTSGGADLLKGNGADRHTSADEIAHPDDFPSLVTGTITQVITNQSVNSAELIVTYTFVREI